MPLRSLSWRLGVLASWRLGVLASWRLGGAQTVFFEASHNHVLEENRPRLANQMSYTDGGLKQWLPHASHVIVSIDCRVFYGNE